jgi:hypothetical protein
VEKLEQLEQPQINRLFAGFQAKSVLGVPGTGPEQPWNTVAFNPLPRALPSRVVSRFFGLLLPKGGTGKWKTRNSTFFRLFFFANAHLCASRRYQCDTFRMLIFVH